MNISDISNASWEERFQHYIKQNTSPGEQPTYDGWNHSVNEANTEMLNEIHTMLLHLSVKADLVDEGLINDNTVCGQQEIPGSNQTPQT